MSDATNKTEIEEKVKEVIVESLSVDAEKVTPESTLADLGADSLDQVEIIMALEEKFDIELSDDETNPEKLPNVQAVYDVIAKKVAAK